MTTFLKEVATFEQFPHPLPCSTEHAVVKGVVAYSATPTFYFFCAPIFYVVCATSRTTRLFRACYKFESLSECVLCACVIRARIVFLHSV
jgi:hypothetical protein